jgi:hypothetical protein
MTGVIRAADAEDELGNWLIYNGTVQFTDQWSLFTEAQLRLYEVTSDTQEVFVRFAGQYNIRPDVLVALGYTRVRTWPLEALPGQNDETKENRIFEQFSLKSRWARSVFDHRYRLEQRWVKQAGSTTTTNRFRYRLQITAPLNRTSMVPGAHFINFYDEIFINLGKPREFDQNRLYVAYGHQFTPTSNLQVGALWQARTSEDFFRLQIFYTHNFDLR